jgi:hypothetical protein
MATLFRVTVRMRKLSRKLAHIVVKIMRSSVEKFEMLSNIFQAVSKPK